MAKALLVYVTAPDGGEADRIGRAVVEERLAACANILGGMRSIYWWEGKLETGAEAVLVLKTAADRAGALVARVRALHPYECPCVVCLPIEGGHGGFLDWIVSETRAGD
jgi:periplasmic divalent cation tolerance protein